MDWKDAVFPKLCELGPSLLMNGSLRHSESTETVCLKKNLFRTSGKQLLVFGKTDTGPSVTVLELCRVRLEEMH